MRLIKAAAFAAFLAVGVSPSLAAAQQQPMPAHMMGVEGALLTISADGTSEAAPDMATISAGVVTDGASAAAALAANAQRMNTLIQALRRGGVAERDIQTSNVSVSPQYAYEEGESPRVTGYQANNSVNAKVRALANLGRLIDAAVAAGGNTINGVSFSHQDPDAQLDAARRDAAASARQRADLYAEAFGMRVHRVIAISEGGGYAPPMPMVMMEARMSADAAPTPVAPGEIETRVSVSVTYELR